MSTNETTTTAVTVAGMTCGHCATSVENEIRKINGVEAVRVDVESGIVTVVASTPPSADAPTSRRWSQSQPDHRRAPAARDRGGADA